VARPIRIQLPDAFYHVVSRGHRDESIFADETDQARFLDTLGETCARTRWRVHAFVLMPNHFHLLIQTPNANLVDGMKWMLGTYTVRYNVRHRFRGHLFAGRYRSQLVAPSGEYLEAVADYIHLNPDRSGLVNASQPLRQYPWSSLRYELHIEAAPKWFAHGAKAQDAAALEARLEGSRGQAPSSLFESIRRGWCFGDDSFRQDMHERINARAGTHAGEASASAAEANAEGLVIKALAKLGWSEVDLCSRPKGDGRKLALAQRLRRETTMTVKWIAARLAMGTAGYLNHLLYWDRRGTKPHAGDEKAPRTQRKTTPSTLPRVATDIIQTTDAESVPFVFDTAFD